ncbi:WD domain, g-beta repeat domain-containing protein [Phthorimaea operculella]|nr:WD domain, g-beta repeat domain-containing protein [Phthorimaea operculella]
MSLMKKTRNDAVKAAVASYLERRNYPDVDIFSNNNSISRSAEQMAVATIVQCEASRANSILFSCINNDPGQYDVQYTRLVNYIKDIKTEKVKNELLGLLSPLLCHLYLEMLRGGHGGAAQMFLKRHSATLPQKDLSYHQPIDGNLPSALYRPNSLEQLFNSLQNGTIDNETPEKDFMNQILDDIGSIYTLQEVESRPTIAAFRSCKYDIYLSQDALNMLKAYLAKHGHVLLIQVLQTWFHIDVNNDPQKKDSEDDEDQTDMENEINVTNTNNETKPDINEIFSKCNGHAYEYQSVDKELRDLQDAIKGVRDSMAPVKLYKVAAPDTYLVCAKTDPYCNVLCGGFANSELRLWDLGQNNVKRRVNRNISEVELACHVPVEPETPADNTLVFRPRPEQREAARQQKHLRSGTRVPRAYLGQNNVKRRVNRNISEVELASQRRRPITLYLGQNNVKRRVNRNISEVELACHVPVEPETPADNTLPRPEQREAARQQKHLRDLGQNNVKRRVNRNISEVELACHVPVEPETPADNTLPRPEQREAARQQKHLGSGARVPHLGQNNVKRRVNRNISEVELACHVPVEPETPADNTLPRPEQREAARQQKHLRDLGQNNVKRRVNRNISEVELACHVPVEPETPADNTLQIGTGVPLRGHSGPVQAVTVLPKKQLILSASHDNTMRAWRIYDYSCAAIYRCKNSPTVNTSTTSTPPSAKTKVKEKLLPQASSGTPDETRTSISPENGLTGPDQEPLPCTSGGINEENRELDQPSHEITVINVETSNSFHLLLDVELNPTEIDPLDQATTDVEHHPSICTEVPNNNETPAEVGHTLLSQPIFTPSDRITFRRKRTLSIGSSLHSVTDSDARYDVHESIFHQSMPAVLDDNITDINELKDQISLLTAQLQSAEAQIENLCLENSGLTKKLLEYEGIIKRYKSVGGNVSKNTFFSPRYRKMNATSNVSKSTDTSFHENRDKIISSSPIKSTVCNSNIEQARRKILQKATIKRLINPLPSVEANKQQVMIFADEKGNRALKDRLGGISWDKVYESDDVNYCFNALHCTLLAEFETCVPKRKVRGDTRKADRGWITDEIKSAAFTKRALFVETKIQKGNEALANEYKELSDALKRVVVAAKKDRNEAVILNSRDKIRSSWSLINENINGPRADFIVNYVGLTDGFTTVKSNEEAANFFKDFMVRTFGAKVTNNVTNLPSFVGNSMFVKAITPDDLLRSNDTSLSDNIRECMRDVIGWFAGLDLETNVDKTNLIHFRNYNTKVVDINVDVSGKNMKLVAESRFLGITTDEHLSWKGHVEVLEGRGHNYPIWCMDVTTSGLFIVTGSHDKTAKLWSLDRTFPIRVFVGHMSDVTCVKFHPNEAYVATGGADRSVRMWSVSDARLVRVLCGHRGVVRALAFAPQGTFLASAGDDKKIKVWDLHANTCIHEYRGHHGKVTALDWSSIGKPELFHRVSAEASEPAPAADSMLCSAGMDGVVKLVWDNQCRNKRARAVAPSEPAPAADSMLCSAGMDGVVKLVWDNQCRNKRARAVAPSEPAPAADSMLCSAGMDGVVKLVWDNQCRNKQTAVQEVQTATYNTKCSYLVDVQVHPDWVVAIGTKR